MAKLNGLNIFPTDINSLAWKSTKAQKWNTARKTAGSGKVRTMTTWQLPQWTITATFVKMTIEEYKRIMGFFATVKGGYEPFLWLDPEDNHEKGIVLGNGSQGQWQALKTWGTYREPTEHIDEVKVYADGKPIDVVVDRGLIKLAKGVSVAPNAVITADYRYYWQVYLSGDTFTAEYVFTNLYKSKEMKLITCR